MTHRGAVRGAVLGAVLAACGGRIDGDATGADRAKATGGPADVAGGGGGAGAGAAGPRPACALATPLREGFDDYGMPPEWGAAPGGLQFDMQTPIDGAGSLEIDVARALLYRGLVTTHVGPACAATLKLTVKMAPPLFGPGANATIARLSAAPAFYDLVLGEAGSLAIVEVQQSATAPPPAPTVPPSGPPAPGPAPAMGPTHPLGALSAGVPADVVLAFDLSRQTMTGSVTTRGGPAPAPTSATLTIPHGDIVGIVLGLFAGTATSGTYWLDDFALE